MAAIAPQLIGESALFHALMDRVSDLASLGRPVFITGERGTGKELIASRLHFLSPRWEQAYVRVNCAAFTDEALEIELFGDGHTDGRLASANGGTVFLDNIDRLSAWLQEKIMRVVEHGEYEAPESQITETVDVQWISAATDNDDDMSAELMDRLAAHMLVLPPLRERPDDIIPLVTFFGRRTASDLGADRFPGLTPEALAFLQAHKWPGNVRELRNVVERSVAEAFLRDETLSEPIHDMIMDTHGQVRVNTKPRTEPNIAPIAVSMPPSEPRSQDTLVTNSFTDRVMAFERQLLDQAMAVNDHHQGQAAEYLDLTYHQFRGLLRKHGLKK